MSEGGSIDISDIDSIESERSVVELFNRRRLPRSFHWLHIRSDDFARAHLPTVIDSLCDQGLAVANGDGTWSRLDGATSVDGDAEAGDDSRTPVLIDWENALYKALVARGVCIKLHRYECGYHLLLALTAFAAKLDVEIDGRQHQMLASQRSKDIVRDQRLKAGGWTVLRLSVSEVVADLAGSCDRVLSFWNKLKDGGSVE